ncbi:hypothetical protein LTR17_025388 [Elasticomyces elasticus]|nr:hypothetical protein LTR17_025388 [Elasticomyces elasticus]
MSSTSTFIAKSGATPHNDDTAIRPLSTSVEHAPSATARTHNPPPALGRNARFAAPAGHVQALVAKYNATSATIPTVAKARPCIDRASEPRKTSKRDRKSEETTVPQSNNETQVRTDDPELEVKSNVEKAEEDAEQDWVLVEMTAELEELAQRRNHQTALSHATFLLRSCLLALRSER